MDLFYSDKIQTFTYKWYNEYRKDFEKLMALIKETLNSDPRNQGLQPVRIGRIRNSTAAKYIKLLIDIENKMRENEDELQ